jgi:hypothetical protein
MSVGMISVKNTDIVITLSLIKIMNFFHNYNVRARGKLEFQKNYSTISLTAMT